MNSCYQFIQKDSDWHITLSIIGFWILSVIWYFKQSIVFQKLDLLPSLKSPFTSENENIQQC